MAASTTDKFDRVTDATSGRPVIAKLAAGKNIGDASITLTDTTNWTTTTKIHFAIYNLTAAGYKDVTSQTDWEGTLPASSTTVSNLVLRGGTDQQYTTDAYVELTPTASWTKDLYDGLAIAHNNDGTLKQAAVKTALGITSNATGGWDILNGGTAPTTTSGYNLGFKQYKLTYANVDLTSVLSKGMRHKVDRSVAPPTKCFQFQSASSQYATKTSPTGITFTDSFTVEAWVFLSSYTDATILSRFDGTNGWRFSITTSGAVYIQGLASGANVARQSASSIPLGTWVHVAASLTMSTSAATIYIDGVQQANVVVSSVGTALSQGTGPLQMGAYNGASFFNGYASEVRLWSGVQTQTQIRDNMCVNLTGSETNLIGLWQGGTNFNDLDSNANNFTAVNSATAVASGNPFSVTEYGLVTDVTYSAPNTTVVVTGGPSNNHIPLATMVNPYSSYQATPYGWPGIKWEWFVLQNQNLSASGGTSFTANTFALSPYLPGLAPAEAIFQSQNAYVSATGQFSIALSLSGVTVAASPTIAAGTAVPIDLITMPIRTSAGTNTPTVVFTYVSGSTVSIDAAVSKPILFMVRVKQG